MLDNDEPVFTVTSNLVSLAGVLYKKRFHSWLNPILSQNLHAIQKLILGAKYSSFSPFFISPFSHSHEELDAKRSRMLRVLI